MKEHKPIQQCRSYGAAVACVPTNNHKLMPVDAITVNHHDYELAYSRHKSHFSLCPHADDRQRVRA